MSKEEESTETVSARMEKSTIAALARLARQNGREVSEQLEFLVIEALIEAGELSAEQAAIHRLRENLVRDFLRTAVGIVEAEGHRDDITAEAARRVLQDPAWKADYETYRKVRDKATINPTFGRRVKLRLDLVTGKVYAVAQPSIFSSSSYLQRPPVAPDARAA